MSALPLFYAGGLAAHQVALLAQGVIETSAVDTLDFPDENGGDVSRELGVPFVAGMDDIQVEQASLRLRAKPKGMDVAFQATSQTGGGVIVSLGEPRRVSKIEIQYSDPAPQPNTHLVVRAVTGSPGSFQPGPPIFADPPFNLGPMFAPALGGMTVSAVTGGGKLLSFPPQLGTAWLIQLATGEEATKLTPSNVTPTVHSVTADLLPENLSLVLAADDGPITLWSHPNLLLAESGFQAVSFLPLAQKHLSKKVKSAGKPALTVPLNFHSDSGCQLEVTDQQLAAEYRVKPLAEDPLTLQLRGGWNDLTFAAPAGRRPMRASADITVKLLGRALNAGSPEPPIAAPSAGWRVDQARQVAAARAFQPVDGANAPLLASVRVLAEAAKDCEVVLELRGDAAGIPGQVLAKPIVLQVKQGAADWLEFVLPQPLPVTGAGASVWATLRANRGELLWFAGAPAAGGARVSIDKAKAWAQPDEPLAPAGDPWLQLFHVEPDPQPKPVVRLRHALQTLASDLLAGAARQGPREFRAAAVSLPVFDVLAAMSGEGRTQAQLHVFSASAADLTISGATLAYDPFAGPSGGGPA